MAQNDIKKVLAYSTISQLGYMFLAVGVGGYVAGIFHMVTHAFFKALLFLAAGSVIHGMHHEQDMRRFGGLYKLLPVTCGVFIVGWLAIAGVPPFSGFWSKDEILAYAWDDNKVLWLIGLVVALLTAFYMSRATFLTFFGRYRYADPTPEEIDEAWDAKIAASEADAESSRRRWMRPAPTLESARAAVVAADDSLRQGRGRGGGGPSRGGGGHRGAAAGCPPRAGGRGRRPGGQEGGPGAPCGSWRSRGRTSRRRRAR